MLPNVDVFIWKRWAFLCVVLHAHIKTWGNQCRTTRLPRSFFLDLSKDGLFEVGLSPVSPLVKYISIVVVVVTAFPFMSTCLKGQGHRSHLQLAFSFISLPLLITWRLYGVPISFQQTDGQTARQTVQLLPADWQHSLKVTFKSLLTNSDPVFPSLSTVGLQSPGN